MESMTLSKMFGRWLLIAAIAMPMGAWASDPQVAAFTDNPDPVPAGGLYDYALRVDNNDVQDATNVFATVTVPSGATFVSASPAGANCAPLSATQVRCNLGTVGGNGADVRNILLTWRATGPGPATINATAAITSSNDTNAANNSQGQTTTVVNGADLTLAKSGSPNPVVGGANVTYTLTVGNRGPNTSGDIVVTDTLPPSIGFVSGSGSGWACSAAGQVVTCIHAGTHAVGANLPALSIVGTVNVASGTVTNSATVSPALGGTADPDNTNNTATANTTVLAGADVRIQQKIVTSAVPATAGQNTTFQIQPRNSGPAPASSVSVTDTLPAGWTFVSASGPNFSCSASGQLVTCTRATMPVGAADDITVVARAPSNAAVGPTGTTYTNTANITTTTTDPTPSNNSGSVAVQVLPDGADLAISKSKTPNPVAVGSNMTSTIDVKNFGPRVANGPLRVVEVLSGETFASASGSGWVCTPNGNVVVCDYANAAGLAVGANLPTLQIVTTATSAGAVSNTACTGSSVPAGAGAATASPPAAGDANNTNDCATVSGNATTVRPDLSIAKTTSTPTGGDKIVSAAESFVTYTLVGRNASVGADAATGVVITDTVPGFLLGRSTFGAPITASVSGGTATFNCATSGATVTCTQTGGALAQGQTVTVPIRVNRPLADGSFTNTATIGNTAEGDPGSGNNSASDTVQIDPIADIEMTGKTVTPSPVRAGENSTYVLSFRNNGPSTAAAVVLTDTFTFPGGDTGVTVVSITSSASGSTCSIAAGAVLNSASSSFNCTIGNLADGENQTVTLVVRPNFQSGNAARVFTNVGSVTTTTVENPAGGNNGNNSQSATLNVSPASLDLLVNKTDEVDPVPYISGNTFSNYRVRVTSNGPSFATNARITERMVPPAGKRVRFVCDVTGPGSATCNSPTLCSAVNLTSAAGAAIPDFTCSVPAGNATTGVGVGQLAANQSKDIYLRFEILDQPSSSGDVFNNTATVSSNEPDSAPANDSVTEPTTIRQRVDLQVTKATNVSTATINQPFNWTVVVTNNGPGNSLQTDLNDTLPAGVQVTGPITWTKTAPAATGTCPLAGSAIGCTLGALNALGTVTITVPARIVSFPAGGTLTNSATVDTDPSKIGGIDNNPGNNTGSVTMNVTRSSLAGTAFEDRDRTGANGGTPQAAGIEPRIGSVAVTLTGTDLYGNPVSLSTFTDGNGDYLFDTLPPSNATGYTVTETQPAGYVNSPANLPTAGATAPSAGGTYAAGGGAGNSSVAGVVLGGSVVATNYNFPEVRRPSLSGVVYIDSNANGSYTAGTDTPIANATVRLLNAGTLAVVATTTTNGAGAYSFANLDPLIAYLLEEPLPATPAGLQNGPVNPGLVNGAACAAGCTAQPNTPAAGTDRIAAIDLSAGADGTQFNFGEVQIASISGTVYIDRNRSNTIDASPTDGRIPGVTLRLVQGASCASGTTLQTVTTGPTGAYTFTGVTAGANYLICETQPAGYANGVENPGTGATTPAINTISIVGLPVGGSSGNDFGERLASIAGSVYQDFSAGAPANTDNGVRDAGEAGIVNVPVTLTGNNANGPVNITVLTDASGNYLFDDLLPSDAAGYTITEGAIPAASGTFNDGKDALGTAGGSAAVNDVFSGVVLTAGQQGATYNFGELPIAPITGTVYLDRNTSGTLDPTPTDGRLPGVTVRLVLGPNCSGTVVATTTTDASGNYSFSGASAGLTYTLCETQPPGYADGGVNPGTNGSSSAPNSITLTNLPAAGSAANHFGERAGSIAGSVWLDANNDGTRQGGEAGIAGVTVTLTGVDANGASVTRTAITDASGNYSFVDLVAAGPAGYTVTEQATQPVVGAITTLNGRTAAGTISGTPSGTATPVATAPSRVGGIALPAGGASIANNFGEILPVSIAGVVFIDLNNNGVQNLPGDAGLAGVTITITGTDDTGAAVSRTLTTAADGSYSAPDLRPGTYAVVEPTQPAGTSNGLTVPGSTGGTATPPATVPSAISGIVLTTPGTASTANNFAEIANSSAISGRVWFDANNNNTLDPTEAGIAGVVIELSGTDLGGTVVNRTTTTDASGNYSFPNLAPGTYSLREPTQPPNTVNGATLPGTLGGTASTPATTPSTITGIVLAVGQTATANNFGEIAAASIAGRVYADNNNNGTVEATETGLGGVTLTLTGTNDLGAAVSASTVTDATGNYSFPGLRPGTYTVTEPTQPAATVNGITTPGTVAGTSVGAATPVATLPSAISAIVLPLGGASIANNFGEIGNSPDLRVSKSHAPTTLTVGKEAVATIVIRNAGQLATAGTYTVSDRLPTGLTLAAVPTGTGWSCTGAVGATAFTCSSSTVVPAGANGVSPITARINVAAAAAAASPVNNGVLVEGGGEIEANGPTPAERAAFAGNVPSLPACSPAVLNNACRDPAVVQLPASLSGTVWYDIGTTPKLLDAGDRVLPNWIVEVVDPATGTVVGRATTGSDGRYKVIDLTPGVPYDVRFRDPQSGVVFGYPVNGETAPGSSGAPCAANGTPAAGSASSCVGTGANPQLRTVLAPGQELVQQSLPVDPSGVVYDSRLRQPVPGSIVTLTPTGACAGWSPATSIVGAGLGGYTTNGNAISMTVGNDGLYQFLFAPAAPANCVFGLTVTPPAGYTFTSTVIPPSPTPLVPGGAPGSTYAVQPQAAAPSGAVGTGTTYFLTFTGGSAGANIIHNHVPLDPAAATGLALSKTGDKAVAEIGDSVRYTITVQLTSGPRPVQTTIVDRLPRGFTFIAGTAIVNGTPVANPVGGLGPTLAFNLGTMPATNQLVLQYRVRVGVGAMQGDGLNRAQGYACGNPSGCVGAGFVPQFGSVATNESEYRVRVTGGVFATEACVLGKVFVDCNGNSVQDREELGIPGVRLVMSDGTNLVSDSEGKYSVCGVPPRSQVLKVDGSTLPRGSRLTTSSNRNLGDANSLFLDLKNGELHRADFIEGSCSNTVLEQVKARRAQGEVRAPEAEKGGAPALRFDSKAHGKGTFTSPQQGTDGANQLAPKPRTPPTDGRGDDQNKPTPSLPMNQPPPTGRDSGTAPEGSKP